MGFPPSRSDAQRVSDLGEALAATDRLIARVKDDQWSNPTPCPEWDVRALVNHLVFGIQLFADIIGGEPPPMEGLPRLRAMDHLGDDPLGAYRAAGVALTVAFSQPTVFERVFDSPVGPRPGAAMLHLRITEVLVHGWDLAQATSQAVRLPEGLAELELEFARTQLADNAVRTGRFADGQPVADNAPAIDRLVAYLGRPLPTPRENEPPPR